MACSVTTLVAVLWFASARASLHDSQGWSVSKHTYGPARDVQAKLVCEYLWPGSYSRVVAPREGNGGYIIRSALVDQLNGKYTVGHQYTCRCGCSLSSSFFLLPLGSLTVTLDTYNTLRILVQWQFIIAIGCMVK